MSKRFGIPIFVKLVLLAGIPVVGALLLGLIVQRDAQRQAKGAEAIGTIEDLAQLSSIVSGVIHSVQDERAQSALDLPNDPKASAALASMRGKSDASVAELERFLAARSLRSLPARLGRDLASAVDALGDLDATRRQVDGKQISLEKLLEQDGKIVTALNHATAALTQLSNDGELLRNITMLVGALEVSERLSREHALLAYVLVAGRFPPGAFREFITLQSEQQLYFDVLRTSATDDQIGEFERLLSSDAAKRAEVMRKAVQETGEDEEIGVRAEDWFGVASTILVDLRQQEGVLASRVKGVAASKVAQTSSTVRMSQRLSVGILLASAAMALFIGRRINRSVSALSSAANEVRTKKDYSIQAIRSSNDELGTLTEAFNEMLRDILARDEELAIHRQNLEGLVESRTTELARRNREMRAVLDAVEQGLVTVMPDGSLGSQQSQAFGAWFPNSEGRPFFEVLAPSERERTMLRMGWESVVDDFLPLEVSLDQMVKRLTVGERHFSLAYRPIVEDDRLLAVLLSVTDISSEIERLRIEVQQREFISVFECAMRDRSGFIEFFNETSLAIEALRAPSNVDDDTLVRQVHTLKGNFGVYGISGVAEVCHVLETLAQDEGVAAMRAQLPRLIDEWGEFSRRVVPVLGRKADGIIEVHCDQLQAIIEEASQTSAAASLIAQLARLRNEPIALRFERATEQAKRLARRLGKGEISCRIDDGGVRLPAQRWVHFFSSLVHVIRNAVDHGLEPESERLAAGKSPCGTLTFRARESGGSFVIEVEDDGRGIDWQKIRAKAAAAGLPCATQADLENVIFSNGISTRDTVTEYSGRGVGMAALAAATNSLSGRVDVRSSDGQGTLVRFTFPVLGNDQMPNGSKFPGVVLKTPA